MPTIVLADPVDLGDGRSIRPPKGWLMAGVVAEDPLRLQPSSRVEFYPEEGVQASLSWRLASWLVGKPAAQDFRMLLDVQRQLDSSDLEPFYPDLIRVLLENIAEARVKRHPGAGPALYVTYLVKETGRAGHVLYLPSPEVEGEVQLLSYEGLELPYLEFLEAAMASMLSFRDSSLTNRSI